MEKRQGQELRAQVNTPVFYRIVNVVFAALFIGVVLLSIFNNQSSAYTFSRPLLLISALVGTGLVFGASRLFTRIPGPGKTVEMAAVGGGVALFFALSLGVGLALAADPPANSEFGMVYYRAVAYAQNGTLPDNYFLYYPTQSAFYVLISGYFSFLKALGVTNFIVPLVVLNTLSVCGAVLLMYFCARRLFGVKKALFILVGSLFMVPLLLSGPVAYPYTITLPVPVAIALLWMKTRGYWRAGSENAKKAMLYFGLLSGIAAVGALLKLTVLVVYFAVLFDLFFLLSGRGRWKLLGIGLGVCTAVFALGTLLNSISPALPNYDEQADGVPLSSWIMMGLSENGADNQKDFDMILQYPDKDARADFVAQEIKNRMGDYMPFAIFGHLGGKLAYTFGDPTLGLSQQLAEGSSGLQNVFTPTGSGFAGMAYFAFGIQMAVLAWAAVAAAKSLYRKNDALTFARLALLGLAVFLLIWKTEPGEIVLFIPLFMLCALEASPAPMLALQKKRAREALQVSGPQQDALLNLEDDDEVFGTVLEDAPAEQLLVDQALPVQDELSNLLPVQETEPVDTGFAFTLPAKESNPQIETGEHTWADQAIQEAFAQGYDVEYTTEDGQVFYQQPDGRTYYIAEDGQAYYYPQEGEEGYYDENGQYYAYANYDADYAQQMLVDSPDGQEVYYQDYYEPQAESYYWDETTQQWYILHPAEAGLSEEQKLEYGPQWQQPCEDSEAAQLEWQQEPAATDVESGADLQIEESEGAESASAVTDEIITLEPDAVDADGLVIAEPFSEEAVAEDAEPHLADEPVISEPVEPETVAKEAPTEAIDESDVDEPILEEATTEEAVAENAELPLADEPVIPEPVEIETVAEEAPTEAVDESDVDEPILEEATTEEAVAENAELPLADEPVISEPVETETVAEEAPAEAVDESDVDEPIIAQTIQPTVEIYETVPAEEMIAAEEAFIQLDPDLHPELTLWPDVPEVMQPDEENTAAEEFPVLAVAEEIPSDMMVALDASEGVAQDEMVSGMPFVPADETQESALKPELTLWPDVAELLIFGDDTYYKTETGTVPVDVIDDVTENAEATISAAATPADVVLDEPAVTEDVYEFTEPVREEAAAETPELELFAELDEAAEAAEPVWEEAAAETPELELFAELDEAAEAAEPVLEEAAAETPVLELFAELDEAAEAAEPVWEEAAAETPELELFAELDEATEAAEPVLEEDAAETPELELFTELDDADDAAEPVLEEAAVETPELELFAELDEATEAAEPVLEEDAAETPELELFTELDDADDAAEPVLEEAAVETPELELFAEFDEAADAAEPVLEEDAAETPELELFTELDDADDAAEPVLEEAAVETPELELFAELDEAADVAEPVFEEAASETPELELFTELDEAADAAEPISEETTAETPELELFAEFEDEPVSTVVPEDEASASDVTADLWTEQKIDGAAQLAEPSFEMVAEALQTDETEVLSEDDVTAYQPQLTLMDSEESAPLFPELELQPDLTLWPELDESEQPQRQATEQDVFFPVTALERVADEALEDPQTTAVEDENTQESDVFAETVLVLGMEPEEEPQPSVDLTAEEEYSFEVMPVTELPDETEMLFAETAPLQSDVDALFADAVIDVPDDSFVDGDEEYSEPQDFFIPQVDETVNAAVEAVESDEIPVDTDLFVAQETSFADEQSTETEEFDVDVAKDETIDAKSDRKLPLWLEVELEEALLQQKQTGIDVDVDTLLAQDESDVVEMETAIETPAEETELEIVDDVMLEAAPTLDVPETIEESVPDVLEMLDAELERAIAPDEPVESTPATWETIAEEAEASVVSHEEQAEDDDSASENDPPAAVQPKVTTESVDDIIAMLRLKQREKQKLEKEQESFVESDTAEMLETEASVAEVVSDVEEDAEQAMITAVFDEFTQSADARIEETALDDTTQPDEILDGMEIMEMEEETEASESVIMEETTQVSAIVVEEGVDSLDSLEEADQQAALEAEREEMVLRALEFATGRKHIQKPVTQQAEISTAQPEEPVAAVQTVSVQTGEPAAVAPTEAVPAAQQAIVPLTTEEAAAQPTVQLVEPTIIAQPIIPAVSQQTADFAPSGVSVPPEMHQPVKQEHAVPVSAIPAATTPPVTPMAAMQSAPHTQQTGMPGSVVQPTGLPSAIYPAAPAGSGQPFAPTQAAQPSMIQKLHPAGYMQNMTPQSGQEAAMPYGGVQKVGTVPVVSAAQQYPAQPVGRPVVPMPAPPVPVDEVEEILRSLRQKANRTMQAQSGQPTTQTPVPTAVRPVARVEQVKPRPVNPLGATVNTVESVLQSIRQQTSPMAPMRRPAPAPTRPANADWQTLQRTIDNNLPGGGKPATAQQPTAYDELMKLVDPKKPKLP